MRAANPLFFAAPLVIALFSVACDDGGLPSDTTSSSSSSSSTSSSTSSSSTSTSSSTSSGDGGPDCVMNPMTHIEIINACTDAEQVDKAPVLPLLEPDGGLPPLP